jgi:hypothetical protein
MYGLKPVPFKDCTLLFLELWSTGFAVSSVRQQGTEITVKGVCGQLRKSDRWVHDLTYSNMGILFYACPEQLPQPAVRSIWACFGGSEWSP